MITSRNSSLFGKVGLIGATALATSCGIVDNKEATKPNIIYILADDMGYGELGCYGQTKIETPNIDKLAKNGMLFTQHYSGAPVSAPSRCSLLTGKHTGHAFVRGNDEWTSRGNVWNYKATIKDSTLEEQRPLPLETVTIGKLLQQKGYKTAAIGKWGLGAPGTTGMPDKQGFDYFYGFNCQRQAHNYYPVHLYENNKRVYLNNDTVAPGQRLSEKIDPRDLKNYTQFTQNDYAPDLMFQKMIGFVEQHQKQPFFLYWATPIPHTPIQAQKKWVDYYQNKFGDEAPYTGNKGYFPHRYPHAGYAAMISYLDERVGMLIKKLKELKIYDNTIIIFTSDNGPTFNGGTDSPWFNSAGAFKSEFGWGKCFVHEGGVRIPMIAVWNGKIKPNTTSNHISAFWDVLPTICDIVHIDKPLCDGISFLPTLLQKSQEKHEYLYWEYPEMGGQMAVRYGNYKAICQQIRRQKALIFELYDLTSDPKEQNNIASKHPDIIAKIKEIVTKEHIQSKNKLWQMKALDSLK